ncbi:MAG: type II secretion system F family protein [Woeseiaceae bacterium]|nr:type II secretion system F family protein [Woeseiaceae bacterium]
MALEIESPRSARTAKPKRDLKSIEIGLPGQNRAPTSNDRMFFTEQLALLLETGESLHGALAAIVTQTESPRMRTVVEQIAQDISEGQSFAGALKKHDSVFSSTYVNLIAASETGGFMHEVLEQLLQMDQKREELRNTLVSAATYPLFLISFSIAVVVFVLIVVFPKFEAMFSSIYDQLPATTRALMVASHVMREYWYLLLGGIGGTVLLARQWLASTSGRERLDHLKLRLPVARDIFTQVYLTQALQVLGLSLRNGVSVVESLESCRDVVRNSQFRKLIEDVEIKVQAGAGVAAGFSEADFIPDLAKHMISTGERSGNLGKVMSRIAEYYNMQLKKRLDTLSKLAEPIMLLVMGVMVGVLVSSLILPIFKLSRAVS